MVSLLERDTYLKTNIILKLMEEEYIFLKIKIDSEIDITNYEVITEINSFLNNKSYEVMDINPFFAVIYDTTIMEDLQIILDKYLGIYKFYRYGISLYEKGKKYPLTIRINKKGKKVITKNQTKLLSI